MSLMDLLDDYLFGPMNLINQFEGVFKLLLAQNRGVRFAILRQDKGGEHSLREVQELLRRYHIDTFGCTHDAKHLYFLTKARQASWAEYILLRAGIALHNAAVNPQNKHYITKYSPGSLPTPWDEKSAKSDSTAPWPTSTPTSTHSNSTSKHNSLFRQLTQTLDRLFD